ncbi:MAG: arsenate reductase (glutaredoxin) [Acinetobacter sp.]|jgi:arsenate reductase
MTTSSDVKIYHNPACGTSRNTLALIRNAGIEPNVIEYLITPPTRSELIQLIQDANLTVRAAIRKNVDPYRDLELDREDWTDEQLISFMLEHPILINRPFVVTALGTRLSRPSEAVLDILPLAQKGAFTKEDGEQVIDENGKRVN